MGCNCKKVAKNAQKYTDEETLEEPRGVKKASNFLTKFFVVILLIVVLIICMPFIVAYALYCVLTGNSVNISKILRRHNGKN